MVEGAIAAIIILVIELAIIIEEQEAIQFQEIVHFYPKVPYKQPKIMVIVVFLFQIECPTF